MSIDERKAALEDRLSRLNRYLESDPQNATLLRDVAHQLYLLGRFDEASIHIERTLALDPNDFAARSLLGSISIAAGQNDRAIEHFNALKGQAPDDPVLAYNLAYAQLSGGNASQGLAELERVGERLDTVPGGWLLKARLLHHAGNVEAAMKCVERAGGGEPLTAEAAGVLSLLYLDAGNVDQAAAFAQDALTRDANNMEGLLVAGTVALGREDLDTSQQLFSRALELNPNSGRAQVGLGLWSMRQTDFVASEPRLREATRLMPSHTGSWLALGWCQLMQSKLDDCEQNFRHAVEIDRSFSESHGSLAVVLIAKGQFDEAAQACRRAMRLDPNSFSGRYAESLLARVKGDAKVADRILEEVLASVPSMDGKVLSGWVGVPNNSQTVH